MLLLGERRLVHQHIGLMRGDRKRLTRRGITRDHELAPLARGAHHLLGRHAVDSLPALEPPEIRSRGHAQALGERWVEVPRPGVLDEHISKGRAAVMAHGHGGHPVSVVLHRLGGRKLDHAQLIRKPPIDEARIVHQAHQPWRPIDRQRLLAFAQPKGLQHPRQPQPVIGMEVREKDAIQIRQPNRAHQLALRPLATVEQQTLGAAAHQDRGQPAARAGHGAAGAGEEER